MARPPTRSVVYAGDGSVLAMLHGDQDRKVVPLSAIPTTVRNAVLAAEDARYYRHGAVDLRGIVRAAAVDLASGQLREGGSSIAQQYVKNVVTGDQRSLQPEAGRGASTRLSSSGLPARTRSWPPT